MYNVDVLSLRWGDIQNFPQGNALKFTCLIGYVLSGSLDVLWQKKSGPVSRVVCSNLCMVVSTHVFGLN